MLSNKNLSKVSETLYVPLMGRIYASKHNTDILYDKAAVSIENRLPAQVRKMEGQNEYTLLASATRSKNMDYYIGKFLREHPQGAIVNAGCGLETMFYRNDNGTAFWFELDLPDVIELRKEYFPECERDIYLSYSMFDYAWMDEVKKISGDIKRPVLVVASGLFHYFEKSQVIEFIRKLRYFNNVSIVFDTVSPIGIKITRRYMKKLNKQDAQMFFCVGRAEDFAAKISPDTKVFKTKSFYRFSKKAKNLNAQTRMKMYFSDTFNMVKSIYLKV